MEIYLQIIPSKPEAIDGADNQEESILFRNYYCCPYDRATWRDDWCCACNDRCPICRAEIEPYHSEEIDNREIAAYLDAFWDEPSMQS